MRNWGSHQFLVSKVEAFALALILISCAAGERLIAQTDVQRVSSSVSPLNQNPPEPHRFWDKANLMLFGGVATVRALDYTSTQHFRNYGHDEVLLTNGIVDNKPLFAAIEAAGIAVSIGAAYWLHQTGHHKLERWISLAHIGVATVGDVHNYSLGPPH